MARVLVVEDDGVIRMVLADSLTDEGHEVRSGAHGQEGLEILRSWQPDLILLDLTMPVLGGRGFREAQRALPPPLCDVPVLLLTGVNDALHVTEDLGANGLLRKPFDLEELTGMVAAFIGPGEASAPRA
ncbi:MAG: response regulator [Dehalococcoidia bacterium]